MAQTLGTDIMTSMAGRQGLAQLEAERDRLMAMIAYHQRSRFQMEWVRIGMIFGIVALIVAALFSGQSAPLQVVFAVVFLGLSAYILTTKVTVFGIKILVWQIGTLLEPGAPEAHRRLADCEAQIMKLKEDRS